MRARTSLLSLILFGFPLAAQEPVDLEVLAHRLAGGHGTDLQRAERLLDSLSSRFRWLATDYQKRSPAQIVERGGGNCFELATLYSDLIRRLGIKHRHVAEINLHAFTPSRQVTAERKVKEAGPRMSVFGERHNDHRWIEIFDERTGSWVPADPSMGVIGLRRWMGVRFGFGERRTIDTSITNDMIAPFAIFVVDSTYSYRESRTASYAIEQFDAMYGRELHRLPAWKDWMAGVERLEGPAREAFRGTEDLHAHRRSIEGLWNTYAALKRQHEARSTKSERPSKFE